jgi:hypothetical protein
VLEQDGNIMGEGVVKGVGSIGGIDDFGHDVSWHPR